MTPYFIFFCDTMGLKSLWLKYGRYFSFVCGLALMTAAGTEYMFSTYAPDLKDLMGYTQTQINFVGTCTNLGIYLGFYMGIVYDFTNARYMSFVGGLFLFIGWFFAYAASIEFFPSSYILMGIFMFIQGNGSNAIYTAALANNIEKFHPSTRGTVVGFLVSMFGLSSAVFSPVYVHIFDSDVQEFLLFFSILLPMIAFTGIIFLSSPSKKQHFEVEMETDSLIEKSNQAPIKEEVNTVKMLLRIDFWLLFIVFMLGAGVGLTIINNLGSLVESLGGSNSSQFVTLLSIFNCLGRIVSGILSDIALRYKILSRISVLALFLVGMGLAQVYFIGILYLDSDIWLYPGVACVGLCYGALMSLSPSITTELFGKTYFGGNWSVIRIAPAFSSFVMSTAIAGKLYERNIDGTGDDCYGWGCYGYTFCVNLGVCIITVLLCLILSKRWNTFLKSEKLLPTKEPEFFESPQHENYNSYDNYDTMYDE